MLAVVEAVGAEGFELLARVGLGVVADVGVGKRAVWMLAHGSLGQRIWSCALSLARRTP